MGKRTACDDIVWQTWLKIIVANKEKKVVIQDNNKSKSSL